MRRLEPKFLLMLVFVAFANPAFAGEDDNYDRILERYHRLMKRDDLDRKAEAIRLLDPNHPRSLPELREVLKVPHWFVRGHAAVALSKVTDEALRAELRLDLLTHEEWRVREGMAFAFALEPVKGDAEALSDALSDDDWEVRRGAAIALAEIVSKESLKALIGALRKEKDPRVSVRIADTLRRVTGRDLGRDGDAWLAWWEKHKDEILKGTEEELKRRDFGGVKLETVTVATKRTLPGEKAPLEIFVLAPLGWSHDVFRPWLDELSRFGRVTYVKLPRIDDLTGSSGYGESAPTYPVSKLVKALEELRKELYGKRKGKNQVVIFAEGAAGWIAERYAISYRKRTAGLVILNGWIDAESYVKAIARMARSPRGSERWAALTLMNQTKDPHDRATYRRISRVLLTTRLADRADLSAWLLWSRAQDPQGFVTVPQIKLGDRFRLEIPTVFFFGANDRRSGFLDAERIRTHFPKNVIAVMGKSRGFPFADEYEKFYDVLDRFFEYYGLR
jgi:pimeloyl-ACP methyl ester carboxylesterase